MPTSRCLPNAYLKVLTGFTVATDACRMVGEADNGSRLVSGGRRTAPATGDRASAARRPRRRLALGWEPPADLDRAAWLATGASLAEFGRVNNWWVGDWIRYGNTRWGEKYVEAAKITGLDGKTLRNIAYVASRFDLSRRRDNLTWSHHAEVAALAPGEQEEWLDRALSLRLSPGDLRLELRSAQRALRVADGDGDADAGNGEPADVAVTCPQCGVEIPLSTIRERIASGPSTRALGAGSE